jgi:hypothetical protein
MQRRHTIGTIAASLVIIVLASSILAYNISQSAALPTIIIETDNSGLYRAVNATTGETVTSSTNQTYVQEQTVNSLANTKAIILMNEITWNHSINIPTGLTVEENYLGKTTSYYNVQNINNNLTNIFGFAIQTAPDTIIYFYRQGNTHAQDKGDIVMRQYTISKATWGNASTVYSDPLLDSRNAAGGIIGDKIYVFFYRYNYTAGSARGSDVGYIVSTDLTGSSWSAYTPLMNNTNASPYGTLIQRGKSTTWMLGYYATIGNIWRIRLITSNDNGATWAIKNTVYNGTTAYGEPALTYLGDDKMLILAREDRNGPLHQFTSDDGGATWIDSGATNLGSNITNKANIPAIQVKGNMLYVLWADRGTAKMMLSESTTDVFHDPSLYNTPNEIGYMKNIASINKGGYPSLVLLDNGELFYVYGNARNNYVVDISSGIIKLQP